MSATTPPTEGTRRVNFAWIGLIILTVLSWMLASMRYSGPLGPNAPVTVAVLIIAGIKAAGIIFEFMEVRLAPRILRAITGLWIVAVLISIIAFYLD